MSAHIGHFIKLKMLNSRAVYSAEYLFFMYIIGCEMLWKDEEWLLDCDCS